MKKLLHIPFLYAAVSAVALSGLFAWTTVGAFRLTMNDLPKTEGTYETIDRSQFESGTLAPATLPPVLDEGDDFPEDDTEGEDVTTAEENVTTESENTTTENSTPSQPVYGYLSYRDDNISIKIRRLKRYDSKVYVADIYLTSAEYLKTSVAPKSLGKAEDTVRAQADKVNAILAINGDYCFRRHSYIIREGEVLYDKILYQSGFEALAIKYDGTLFPFYAKDYTIQELLSMGCYQVFDFGPTLVRDGEIDVTPDTEVAITGSGVVNPRTAIGWVDGLHYMMVVVDGRSDVSRGVTLYELADILKEQGCTYAYNLDGGGSTTMYFNGEIVNQPMTYQNQYLERTISDIVYIGY